MKLTQKKLEDLIFNLGYKEKQICQEYSISREELRSLCKEWQIKIPRGKVISSSEFKKVYLEQDLDVKEVAQHFDITVNHVQRLQKQFNIYKDRKQIYNRVSKSNKETYATGESTKKKKKTMQERYQVDTPLQKEEFKEKVKATNRKRRGVEWPTQDKSVLEKIAESFTRHYQAKHYTRSREYRARLNEIQDKCYQTKKNNGTLYNNQSLQEEQAYQLLLEYFSPNNVVRQYRSELYPFKCDFYIKSHKLFIECQFSHYHGRSPFNPWNSTHRQILNNWKEKLRANPGSQFERMIKVWTIQDPIKRETARRNNLNWVEFFTLEELEAFLSRRKKKKKS